MLTAREVLALMYGDCSDRYGKNIDKEDLGID
jgi:hypothetical protein